MIMVSHLVPVLLATLDTVLLVSAFLGIRMSLQVLSPALDYL